MIETILTIISIVYAVAGAILMTFFAVAAFKDKVPEFFDYLGANPIIKTFSIGFLFSLVIVLILAVINGISNLN